jgi:ATP-dependent RNA helicase SUPV3L1/SUV3
MEAEPEAITTGGLFPPAHIVERFASYFPPHAPFSYILLRLHELAEMHPRFHLCSLKDQLKIADAIHPVKNLTIQDRLSICAAPTNLRTRDEHGLLEAMAKCIADGKPSDLLDLPIPLEYLDKTPSSDKEYLRDLELLHKMIVLYLWLSYRFPHVFKSKPLANHAKTLVEDAIERTLREFSYIESARKRLLKIREQAMKELETAAKTEAPSPPVNAVSGAIKELPEEVIDVLQDKTSFESSGTSVDDMDEYPTPEIGLNDAGPEGSSSSVDLSAERGRQEQLRP